LKVVIFAGGLGTRISEESYLRPKPMVSIGGKPILWHILKIYSGYGFNDFIICLGYKGYMIKEYFMNYFIHNSDVTIDVENNKTEIHTSSVESFKVTLVDTGINTKTAGRLKRIKKYLNGEKFMLTYGDGLSDININELVKFHNNHGKMATVTTVVPEGKFGSIITNDNNVVEKFMEKPNDSGSWINAGFFVLEPNVFDYLKSEMDDVMWEDSPLNDLTEDRELVAYRYNGFWKCMDAIRDRDELNEIWEKGNIPWKNW
tara:strand:+ start:315 stop:1091 length:777 start_codon:yes stop_codon:yes gene_type:complete